MRVGLIRHFKVKRGYPNNLVTSDELMKWVEEYDQSDVEIEEIDLCQINWKKCYSSDLSRAEKTAKRAFTGNIIFVKELREIRIFPLFLSNLKLPLFIHLLFIRLAWLINHQSQEESRNSVIQRINIFLDKILLEEEDILIVGHGGIMLFMRKELIKRGFKGPKWGRTPKNGHIYIFEK